MTLAYYEVFENRQDAMRREYAIKQLPKKEKRKAGSLPPSVFNGNVIFVVADILVSRTDDLAFIGQFFNTVRTPSEIREMAKIGVNNSIGRPSMV